MKNKKVLNVTQKTPTKEIQEVNKRVTFVERRIQERIVILEKQLLRLEIHDRRRNVKIYCLLIQGDIKSEDIYKAVHNMFSQKLGIEETRVNSMQLANVHRLPGKQTREPHPDNTPSEATGRKEMFYLTTHSTHFIYVTWRQTYG